VRYEIERARRHYERAVPGIGMLAPASRRCISAAFRIYAAILDEVARADYDVVAHRAVVPRRRRLALAGRALVAPTRLEPPCA
jgi:phytoene synthase